MTSKAVLPDELTFHYALAEPVPLARPRSRPHLERWIVSVVAGDTQVGDAHVLIIKLEAGRDVRDFADASSGEWRDAAEVPAAGGGPSSHVLVLERIWVAPDYRGHGLGPLIASVVIGRLGRGCSIAACHPAPFEGACRPEDREREIEALGRIWAKVGFRPWRDGVWMLHLDGQQPEAATVSR